MRSAGVSGGERPREAAGAGTARGRLVTIVAVVLGVVAGAAAVRALLRWRAARAGARSGSPDTVGPPQAVPRARAVPGDAAPAVATHATPVAREPDVAALVAVAPDVAGSATSALAAPGSGASVSAVVAVAPAPPAAEQHRAVSGVAAPDTPAPSAPRPDPGEPSAAGPTVPAPVPVPDDLAPATNPWFDAPVATDTDTPPIGIRAVDASGGAGDVADPGPRLPVLPPAPPACESETTDPGLRRAAPAVKGMAAVGAAAGPPPYPYPPFPPLGGTGPAHGPPPVAVGPAAAPPHRWGLGAFLLAELVFLVASGVIGYTLIGDGPVPAGVLAAAIGGPAVIAAGVAVLITIVRGNGPFVDLGLRLRWREFGIGLAFGFGGLFVSLPAAAVYVAVVGEDASTAVGDIFGGVTASPAVALLIALLVVLVAPLCEEILYRGLLWGGITRLGGGAWVAFAVTTLIFALAHFEWPRAILLVVVALPIGLARIYGGGLLSPIVAHQINNLLPGIGLYLALTGTFPAL